MLSNQENIEETTKQHQIEKHLQELKHFHNLILILFYLVNQKDINIFIKESSISLLHIFVGLKLYSNITLNYQPFEKKNKKKQKKSSKKK